MKTATSVDGISPTTVRCVPCIPPFPLRVFLQEEISNYRRNAGFSDSEADQINRANTIQCWNKKHIARNWWRSSALRVTHLSWENMISHTEVNRINVENFGLVMESRLTTSGEGKSDKLCKSWSRWWRSTSIAGYNYECCIV